MNQDTLPRAILALLALFCKTCDRGEILAPISRRTGPPLYAMRGPAGAAVLSMDKFLNSLAVGPATPPPPRSHHPYT